MVLALDRCVQQLRQWGGGLVVRGDERHWSFSGLIGVLRILCLIELYLCVQECIVRSTEI